MSQLTFKTRKDGAEHSINLCPARDTFRALALSFRGLGHPDHATAFDVLAAEGLEVLSGKLSPLDEEVQQRLKTFESRLEEMIADAESAEHFGKGAGEVLDVFPIVLQILRRMIRA